MGISEHKCEVCNDQYSKYKCPRCLLKYCSLPCYKTHKEATCEVTQTTQKSSKTNIKSSEDCSATAKNEGTKRTSFDAEEGNTVQEEQLERVWKNQEVQAMLQNKHLVELIKHLDSSKSPSEDLQASMRLTIFREFAKKCVSIVDGVSKEGGVSG